MNPEKRANKENPNDNLNPKKTDTVERRISIDVRKKKDSVYEDNDY